ncbi:ABC transporter permease [Demequina sp. NBRC 110054]|uniref:ABC transporter permease n=1 Tax=Demequina sp. NBRC 110054 TaxID=1570343 RepID=UPI000A004AE7|nr:FtsX-like permease family protein [Demequina sp. NBRC 110054]
MFRLAYRSVRHNPKRMLLTAVAVALGVALVSTTLTLTNALSSGFDDLFAETAGTTDVAVEAVDSTTADDDMWAGAGEILTAAEVSAIEAVDGVDGVYGGLMVDGTVLPSGYEADGSMMAGASAPTILYNWWGLPEVDKATLIEGSAPTSDAAIVLDVDSVEKLQYSLGDTVEIATEDGIEKFTLVGLVRFGESNSLQTATLGYMTEARAHEITGEAGYQEALVITEDGADNDAVASEISTMIPEGTRAVTGEQLQAEQSESFDSMLQYIDIFAITFALIALFVGSYIIVNTFRIVVTQRTREFGLMRAIGVTGGQVLRTVLLEAVVIAAVAATLGIGLGYVGALGMAAIAESFVGDIFGAVTLPLDAVLWSYGLATLVTLVSALLPAIHASSIAPMEALREAATESKKPLRLRNVVGAAISALGVAGIVVGLYADLDMPYVYVGIGAMALVIGVTLLAAQVLVPLAFGLRDLLTRVFKIDGKLAANNIRREPRRSANTAAALMIGVMLLALVSTFTESLKSVVTAEFDQMSADLFVADSQGGDVPQGALDIVAGAAGVDLVTSVGLTTVDYDGETLGLVAVDAATTELAFDEDPDNDLTELADGGVFIAPDLQEQGLEVGDEVTLTGASGTATLEVTGLVNSSEDGSFWVDWSTADALDEDLGVYQSLVMLEDGADVDEVQSAILDRFTEEYPLVALQQPDQLTQLATSFIDMILGVISALLGAALVIAILGVANTLLLSVAERTREIGLLRAVGVRRSSVWRMITIESMVMAIFGTVLGMVLGVGLGAALVKALAEFGFGTVTIPWAWLALYTVGAALAGVMAAVWPAQRASRMDILEAVAADG